MAEITLQSQPRPPLSRRRAEDWARSRSRFPFGHALLARIRRFLHQRRLARDLRLGTERLAALSPHLLQDIGLPDDRPERKIALTFGRT